MSPDPQNETMDGSPLPPTGAPAAAAMPREGPVADAPNIPDVTLTKVLGKGGQGLVYRGYQNFLDREVAVKVLHDSVERNLVRFRQEATLLARLQHPNIVACYQAGVTDDDRCFMVLEFVDGYDLHDYIKGHGILSEDAAWGVVADVARGLQHGYETNSRMIHRDVKPENVLLQICEEESSQPLVGKIVDLGLARCLEESIQLTRVGAVMGTPSTMAPEQFDAPHEVDHRTDIYGLGCVMFFALTGRDAYTGSTLKEIYQLKSSEDARPPHRDLELTPGTSRLLDRMLSRTVDGRPETYDDLLGSIREIRLELRGGEPGSPPRKKSTAAGIAAVAAVGAMAAGVGWLRMPESSNLEAVRPSSTAGNAVVFQRGESSDAESAAASFTEPLAPETLTPVPPSIPLLDSIPAGSVVELFPGEAPLGEWWNTVEGGLEPELGSSGSAGWSVKDGVPRGRPDGAFEEGAELAVTKELLQNADFPATYFSDASSSVSHRLPRGAFAISGSFALAPSGPDDFLLGGLALRRGDGTYFELDVVVTFPDGSLAGAGAKRWGITRSAWFSEGGEPLYAASSAAWLQSYAKGRASGRDSALKLSGLFLASEASVQPRDVFTVDFEVRVDGDTCSVQYGDGVEGARDLALPNDFPRNGFCELVVYSRSGFVSLREWKLTGR